MVLLDADAFLTQLTRILESTREKGTMYVTMKRCAHRLPSSPSRDAQSGFVARLAHG